MNLPEIAVYNFSAESDFDVQRAIRAVNRQVVEDFMPVWGAGYLCSLQNSFFTGAPGEEIAEEPVTADAAIYVVDEAHLEGAAGYHFINGREVPYGFVFTESGQWTVTLSHEVLELIVDPNANAFVPGPDPRPGRSGTVLHTYEVCDAVERTSYLIDGVPVSNFVTKQYFVEGDGAGTRNDFLGTPVKSFGVLPGCHLGFFDLDAGRFVVHVQPGAAGEAFDAMPKVLAAKRKGRTHTISEPRLSDATEAAVRVCIEKTKDEGTREILKYALRRDAYREETADIGARLAKARAGR